MRMRNGVLGAAAVLVLLAGSARASVLFQLDTIATGGTPANFPGVIATALFEDVDADTVRLTLTASGLSGSEFITNWAFNLNPDTDAADLQVDLISQSDPLSEFVGFTAGPDAISDFSEDFDLDLTFENAGNNGGVRRFQAGEEFVFEITLLGGLTATMFDALSEGQNGPHFATYAHVQGIDGNPDSSKVADDDPSNPGDPSNPPIPEPSTLIVWSLLGLVAGGYKLARRGARG